MKQPICERFWIEKQPEGHYMVGLMPDYLERLGTIWTFVPREPQVLVNGKPFANLESSKCLGPLRSPINGKIEDWNRQFLAYPDLINHNEYLFIASLS